MAETPLHAPYAALHFPDFRLYISGRFITAMGEQMLNVAIGWELYERTHAAIALGLVGLVQVLPVILLTLPAGHLADRFDRRRVVILTQICIGIGALWLTWLSWHHGSIPLVYLCLFIIACAGACSGPSMTAMLPQTVPTASFTNAATWSSSAWQLASVLGPALGGIVIAVRQSATLVYVIYALATAVTISVLSGIRGRPAPRRQEATSITSLVAGVRFVWQTKLILSAVTLDMFAVLLGGATTLLPIYALDILHVGPVGLGYLRAAPSVGALCMAFGLAHLPAIKRAGRTLLWAVAGFGLATVVFGLSHSMPLSLLMLFTMGALDNVSVVIRATLLLLRAPDAVRGRVSAVNNLFVGTSNELGGFESGLVASLVGPVLAVVSGGVGTIVVVGCIALLWPELRRLEQLKP